MTWRGMSDFPEPVESGGGDDSVSAESGQDWIGRIKQYMGLDELSPTPLKIMVDCCGILAPIIAAEQLGLQYDLIAASDNNAWIFDFVTQHFAPKVMWRDMLDRDPTTLPRDVDLYISGFMCTPWSSRRAGSSKFWEEPAARTLVASLETLRAVRAKMALFENVPGILRQTCWPKFAKLLAEKLPEYMYVVLEPTACSPLKLGYPIRRDRVYIGLKLRSYGCSDAQAFECSFRSHMAQFHVAPPDNFEDCIQSRGWGAAPDFPPDVVNSEERLPCGCNVDRDCSRRGSCMGAMSRNAHGYKSMSRKVRGRSLPMSRKVHGCIVSWVVRAGESRAFLGGTRASVAAARVRRRR